MRSAFEEKRKRKKKQQTSGQAQKGNPKGSEKFTGTQQLDKPTSLNH